MTEQSLQADPYADNLLAGLDDEPDDVAEEEDEAPPPPTEIPRTPRPQNPSARPVPPASLTQTASDDAEFRTAILRGLIAINAKLERLVVATERPKTEPRVNWPTAPVQGVAAGGEWKCPIHGTSKLVPAGTSKKPPYKPYAAFVVCAEQGCKERPPKVA